MRPLLASHSLVWRDRARPSHGSPFQPRCFGGRSTWSGRSGRPRRSRRSRPAGRLRQGAGAAGRGRRKHGRDAAFVFAGRQQPGVRCSLLRLLPRTCAGSKPGANQPGRHDSMIPLPCKQAQAYSCWRLGLPAPPQRRRPAPRPRPRRPPSPAPPAARRCGSRKTAPRTCPSLQAGRRAQCSAVSDTAERGLAGRRPAARACLRLHHLRTLLRMMRSAARHAPSTPEAAEAVRTSGAPWQRTRCGHLAF